MKYALGILSLFMAWVAAAQVNDRFTDGNFTSLPTWSGDDSLFQVSVGATLQSKGTVSKDISLSTPSTAIHTTEWQLWTRFTLSPSLQNFCRFYIVSDQADLKGALNGYYVQLGGVTGSTDSITLYRQTGATRTRVIGGRPSTVSKSSNTVRIKVLRDASGNWELYSDTTGGYQFQVEGTGNDNVHTNSMHCGVWARFSSSNSAAFYFDDVYAGPVITDTIPPLLDSIAVINSTRVRLAFAEPLDPTYALDVLNYDVSNGLGNPAFAQFENGNPSTVLLDLGAPLTNAGNYTVTASGIRDVTGNITTSQARSFTYFIPTPGCILIAELMPDPSPAPAGIPDQEFIEIYNNSAIPVSLAGWKLSDGTSTAILPAVTLDPDSFLIVCSAANVSLFSPFGNTAGVAGTLPTLNNSDDRIELKDPSDNSIHVVNYSLAWYRDASKAIGGWSLEMLNPALICKGAANWRATNDAKGGTPGSRNSQWSNVPDVVAPALLSATIINPSTVVLKFSESMDSTSLQSANISITGGVNVTARVLHGDAYDSISITLNPALGAGTSYTLNITGVNDCSGNLIGAQNTKSLFIIPVQPASANDIIINELMADPDPAVALPAEEFIELYNRSTKNISLANWTLSDATGTATFSEFILLPDSFVIICAYANTTLFDAYGATLGISSFPSLNNTGEHLLLKDANGVIISEMNYTDAWYRDALKKGGGYTLELINPLNLCIEDLNWVASNSLVGGTPGKQNSVHQQIPDTIPPVLRELITDSLSVLLLFNEKMDQTAFHKDSIVISGASVSSIAASGKDSLLIHLTTVLASGYNGLLVVKGVKDCNGNSTGISSGLSFEIPVQPKPFQILINEIMPDPDPVVALPAAEFIELYNRSGGMVSLKDWTLAQGSSVCTLPDIRVKNDSFILITGTTHAQSFAGYGRTYGVTGFPSLSNEGNTIVLKDDAGRVIHLVTYSSLWYKDNLKKNGGWSLEMIDPANPCGGEENWIASNNSNGGSPGKNNSLRNTNRDTRAPRLLSAYPLSNTSLRLVFNEQLDSAMLTSVSVETGGVGTASAIYFSGLPYKTVIAEFNDSFELGRVYRVLVHGSRDCAGNLIDEENYADFGMPEALAAGDIVMNEILFNPRTGGVDFVEIYNRSRKVVDLKTLLIANSNTDNTIKDFYPVAPDGFLLLPGAYCVVTEDPSIVQANYFTPAAKQFITSQMPSFSDDEGVCILLDAQDTRYDELRYDDKMHFALLDDKDGVSLERIDFNRPTADRSNWTSASGSVGYATPGYRNSQYAGIAPGAGLLKVEPEVFSPDGDGFNDIANFSYKLEEPGYTGSLFIYDAKGLAVKQVLKNEILGTTGTVSWDGITEDGAKAQVGIYIAWFEVFNLKGDVKKTKTTFVVGGKL